MVVVVQRAADETPAPVAEACALNHFVGCAVRLEASDVFGFDGRVVVVAQHVAVPLKLMNNIVVLLNDYDDWWLPVVDCLVV